MATMQRVVLELRRGEGCLGRSAPDEPVFVLVGRDLLAADSVRDWADRLEVRSKALGELTGARQAKIADARATAKAMDAWRVANGGGKLPD
jgi:hypothetical protein